MSNDTIDLNKRLFIKSSLMIGGGLLFGIHLNSDAKESMHSDDGFGPTVWLKIYTDNTIKITVPSVEMGQGVATALPMLLAEEMEADWLKVTFKLAKVDSQFKNPLTGRQQTGGSKSIRGYWSTLREAGASIKRLHIQAAAKKWQVSETECYAELSHVVHGSSGRRLSFSELIPLTQNLEIPKPGTLKRPEKFRIIGKPQRRLDSTEKINGAAMFGMDVVIPNMLVSSVERAPFLAKLKQINAEKALKVADVIDVVEIESGVAVVAKHYWAAHKARSLLEIDWDDKDSEKINSEEIRQSHIDKLSHSIVVEEQGNIEEGIDYAEKSIDAVYEVPFLAHACMEPMNCTAHVQNDRCDIWAPTQGPGPALKLAAKLTRLKKENIHIHPTFVGGGFGRRSEKDFVREAIELSQKMKKPIKVIWSREDDIQHDYYRPASYNQMSGGLDEKGRPYYWQHKLACTSILSRLVPVLTFTGLDPTSTEGATDLPYDIEHQEISYAMVKSNVPVGFWRSVGVSMNGYVRECFLDELAHLGKQDPYQIRRELLKKEPRSLGVLDLVAEKSNWNKPLVKGKYRGIAVVDSFESVVAQVAEISLSENHFKIEKFYCAVDCGLAVNPLSVEAQMEGAIIFGLTAALKGNLSIKHGRVEQSNFHDYPLLGIDETPEIEIHIVQSAEAPTGVGEPGVPPVAPALANAIFSATGDAVRRLPIDISKIKSAMS